MPVSRLSVRDVSLHPVLKLVIKLLESDFKNQVHAVGSNVVLCYGSECLLGLLQEI